MNGDENGNGLPEANITREEMAKILVSASGKTELSSAPIDVEDREDVSSWAEKYVSTAIQLGIMQGSDGKFYPKNNARREEAIVVLYRITE